MKPVKTMLVVCATLAICLNFAACKKDSTTTTPPTDASIQTQTDDQVMVSNETDNATNDAAGSMENNGGTFAQRPVAVGIPMPCDTVHITSDTTGASDSLFINYNGSSNCSLIHKRSGRIILHFLRGFRWKDTGAVLSITYDNFKVVRNADQKTITINGTETITNTSGGLVINLTTGDSVVHTISAHLTVTFGNDSTATWNISKRRVFTYNNGLFISTTGSITGVNRYGNNFTTTILSPVIINLGCTTSPVSGEISYSAPFGIITTTLGLDSGGNAVSLSSCELQYYCKLQYNSYIIIVPYY